MTKPWSFDDQALVPLWPSPGPSVNKQRATSAQKTFTYLGNIFILHQHQGDGEAAGAHRQYGNLVVPL